MAQDKLKALVKEISSMVADSVNGTETIPWEGDTFTKQQFEDAVFHSRKFIYNEHFVKLGEQSFKEMFPEYISSKKLFIGSYLPLEVRKVYYLNYNDIIVSEMPGEEYENALHNPFSYYKPSDEQYYFAQIQRVLFPVGFSTSREVNATCLLQPVKVLLEAEGDDINDPELWEQLIKEKARDILLSNQQEN